MTEFFVDVPAFDGRMPVFVCHPQDGAAFPAVILYMDMYGAREALYEIARHIAAVGYCCAVPDLYYRRGRVLYDFRDERNRVLSTHRLGPGVREAMIAEANKLTDAMVMDDTGALLAHLADYGRVARGAVGAVGYCIGGRFAILAAARFPERIVAAGSLHGTNLVTDRPDSPHRQVGRIRGEVYCGFGANDHYATPEILAALDAAFADAPARYQHAIHPDAGHGYALPDRDIYDAQAALRDWEMIFRMFNRQLRAYGGAPPD